MEPRGTELIARYRANYAIPDETDVSEKMILEHWDLERALTQELLASTPENRWEVFDRCYTRLYSQFEWLNRVREVASAAEDDSLNRTWREAIGDPPQTIYEVGSGKGELLSYLAGCGFRCKGTDITVERGRKHQSSDVPNLTWGTTDGVHLDRFEPAGSYDVVICSMVVEHLHPNDLCGHMRGAREILAAGGRYILSTPHCMTGPYDVSSVFKCRRPMGMHLKEYTYREVVDALSKAGFRDVYYASLPRKAHHLLSLLGMRRGDGKIRAGVHYLRLGLVMEGILGGVPGLGARRFAAALLGKARLLNTTIFLVAQK